MVVQRNLEKIKEAWVETVVEFNKNPWIQRLATGELQLKHYKSFLRETYFQAGRNPQIQTLSTMRFTNEQRAMTKKAFQHAISEIGHDLLALNDLKVLGHDVTNIPNEMPLPNTIALTAFPLYVIDYINPVGYLGYLFHLEFLPTQNGPKYMEFLKKAGVPEEAMTFLKEHAEVDVYHNKLMESYVDELIKTDEDLETVIYCARTTSVLHGQMIVSAFEEAERTNKFD